MSLCNECGEYDDNTYDSTYDSTYDNDALSGVLPLQTCIDNGNKAIYDFNNNIFLSTLQIINAVTSFILFFYILYFAVKTSEKGKQFSQFLYAFFLQPVYILRHFMKMMKM